MYRSAKGTPTFILAEDEMEYGVGIHGEPGIRREKILPSKELAQRIVDDLFLDRPDLTEVAVLVNGFGTTPLQELYVFNNDVCEHLASKGIKIYRTFVGNYMTSIDMAGASVSLLAVDDELKLIWMQKPIRLLLKWMVHLYCHLSLQPKVKRLPVQ